MTIPIVTIALMSGCNDRAAHVAMEAADRQARQNIAVVEATKDIADGSRRMLAADAESRRQHVLLHRDLQAEREKLASQWGELEQAREQLGREMRRESLLAPVMRALGDTAIVLILVGYCWYAIARLRTERDDAVLQELLIHEVVADRPRLMDRDDARLEELKRLEP